MEPSSSTNCSIPTLMFEVRPLRRMDLAHVPAVRTASYWDALIEAGRMAGLGATCVVWQRRASA